MLEEAIHLGDNMELLPRLPAESFQLVYLDPPFNTGREQRRLRLATEADPTATARDSAGGATARRSSARRPTRTATTTTWASSSRGSREAHRLLRQDGTLYLHLDPRESHYAKVLLDGIFGRECFLNEIVWAYDYGARTKRRWPAKHDTILVYVKDPAAYFFDGEAVDREPYMAPGLQTPERAAQGQAPDRRLVAHDRVADRPREDRVPDAEAARRPPAHRPGVLARGRLVPRRVRGQRHARRRVPRARPPARFSATVSAEAVAVMHDRLGLPVVPAGASASAVG